MKYGDVIHNTEDKDWWLIHGANLEKRFVENVCPEIRLDGIINPEKEQDPTVPDLIVNGRLADLKTQNTPFFTASRYNKKEGGKKVPFDPTYTVTFNRKDYLRYRKLYPDIDIYFWVQWKVTKYNMKNGGVINVSPLSGIWYVGFKELMNDIKDGKYPLHSYLRRGGDMVNATESYVLDLNDFEEIAFFK